MRLFRFAVIALLVWPVWSAQTYYLTDNLTSIDPSKWTTVGTLAPGGAGIAGPDAAGGSLISRLPIPDGSAEGEVRMTLRLAASGGTYTAFLQATPDSRTSGPGGGTHIAFEMQNPQFDSQGHCVATFLVLQSVAGVTTLISEFQHACRDGMTIGLAVHGGVALLWPDQPLPMELAVVGSGAGSPGIGLYATPTGNAISQVQLGGIFRVAPHAVDQKKIGVAVFRDRIDVQWPPVPADPAGGDLAGYWIARDGQYFMRTTATMFQDLAVKPGETHTYSIAVVDQHYNFSAPVTFTAAAPLPQNGPPPGSLPKLPKLPR